MTTEQKRFQGAWQVVEVTTTGPHASTNTNPQPGIFIFSGRHYSLTRVTAASPRQWATEEAKATADELRELLRFQAQAGTYETKGDELICHPSVALRVGTTAPGSTVIFAYKLDGDSLSLTWKSRASGSVTNPETMKLRRIE